MGKEMERDIVIGLDFFFFVPLPNSLFWAPKFALLGAYCYYTPVYIAFVGRVYYPAGVYFSLSQSSLLN